jgi:hypothetical protein
MKRAMTVTTSAHAIRLRTTAWPSTISITMLSDVGGACATAARKPTIPSAIRPGTCVCAVSTAISLPIARQQKTTNRGQVC